jgi:Zn-dependent protease with chaperone function
MNIDQMEAWLSPIAVLAFNLLFCGIFALRGRQGGRIATTNYEFSTGLLYFAWAALIAGFFFPYGNFVQWFASYFVAMAIYRRRTIREQASSQEVLPATENPRTQAG